MNPDVVGSGTMPLAAELVNPDIKAFIDVASSASSKAMFRRLMAYRVYPSLEGVKAEIERTYGSEKATIEEINKRLLGSADDSIRSNAGDERRALVHVLVPEFERAARAAVMENEATVPRILDMMEELCRAAIMEQMRALYANGGTLDGPTQKAVTAQIDDYIEALDEKIPFRLSNRNTEDDDMGDGSADAKGDYVRSLSEHMNYAFTTMYRVVVPPPRIPYFPRPVRDLVYYMMLPWLAFKFLAAYVPGGWNRAVPSRTGAGAVNASFNDRRYAEYAIYRAVMDIAGELHVAISALNIQGVTVDTMPKIIEALVNTVTDRYIKKNEERLPGWYQEVARRSEEAKRMSAQMVESNKDFEMRRRNLQVMVENEKRARRAVSRARMQFWIVTGVYFAFVFVLVVMLTTGQHLAVYIMCAVAITLVVVLYGASILGHKRRNRMAPAPPERSWLGAVGAVAT